MKMNSKKNKKANFEENINLDDALNTPQGAHRDTESRFVEKNGK